MQLLTCKCRSQVTSASWWMTLGLDVQSVHREVDDSIPSLRKETSHLRLLQWGGMEITSGYPQPHSKVLELLRKIAILWLWITHGLLLPPLPHFFDTLRYVGCVSSLQDDYDMHLMNSWRLAAPEVEQTSRIPVAWTNLLQILIISLSSQIFFFYFQTISCSKSCTNWDLSTRGTFWNTPKSKTFNLVISVEG